MIARHIVRVAMLCLVLAGCVPSLNPLYDEKNVVDYPRLVGLWTATDGGGHLVFTKDPASRFYRAVLLETKSSPVVFQAAVVRLGTDLYLDLIPEVPPSYGTSAYVNLHVTLWHTFAKLQVSDREMRLRTADPIWLKNYLQTDPNAIAHFSSKGMIYLTADTPQLQEFAAKHDAFFSHDASLFKRE